MNPGSGNWRRFSARLLDRPSRQVSGAAFAIAAVILVLFAHTQWQSYERTVARVQRDTRNAAVLLGEHAARTFNSIEQTLHAVGRLRSDVARGIYRSQASIYTHLKTLRGGSPVLREVGWFDAYGERVATSEQFAPPRTSIARRDAFLLPRASDARTLHVSVPERSSMDRPRQIAVSLRLDELDGSFAGVAVGTVDPDEFAKVYRSLDLGPGTTATLFRRDGVVLAQAPSATDLPGRSLGETALFREHLPRAANGTYQARSPLDGTVQIASYASVIGIGGGFVVNVAVPREEALAEFWRGFTFQAAAAGFVLILLLVGTELLVAGLRRRERLQAQLAEATAAANAARLEAETANRAKSEFLANVSHELRTPLTLILAPLEQLLGQGQPSANWRVQLERMQRNALLLLSRVNDTLDFSKAEAGRLDVRWEVVDLARLVPALADDASAAAEARGVLIACEVDPSLDAVHLDRKHFEKILLNLLSNALKFTPSGGWIRLEARALDGTWFEFSVADSGVGIPADKLPLLFQRFQQVDTSPTRRYGGTGIGLALVKQLTELMGGTVGVESVPDQGSRFSIRLPRRQAVELLHPAAELDETGRTIDPGLRQVRFGEASALAAAPVPPERAVPTPGTRAAHVLVVDDNPDMREYVADLLRDECHVLTASDGLDAWAIAQRQPLDIIVSDVMMPRLDGLGLAARIKATPVLSHIPVILLTARGGGEATASGLESGADDYVAKPFTPAELKARVRAALRMSRTQAQLRDKSREAGMSSVAVGILHNLGNLLNGVTVSSSFIEQKLRHSKLEKLSKVAELLEAHGGDLRQFLERDEKGRMLPAYIKHLSEQLLNEQEALRAEASLLKDCAAHAVGILATQKRFAKRVAMEELVAVDDLMETALRLSQATLKDHGVSVEHHYASSAAIIVDRYKILQILLNLVENACQASRGHPDSTKELRVRTGSAGDKIWIQVEDNGVGIASEHMPLLFNQGFTTKESGQGLGLHSSANLARELGGTLRCQSAGPGKGACFTLELPASSVDEEDSGTKTPALVAE